jgi:hypothetical protein
MALNALLKFTQGLTIGLDGRSLVVASGAAVTVENSTGAVDLQSWTIELLYAPPGSVLFTLTPQTVAVGGATAPTWVFTPDAGVYGLYRIRLTTYSGPGYTGTRDVDIRNVAVVTPNQKFLVYSPQLDPKPLPMTGTGAKPNEFNFNGQPFGWAGDDEPTARGLNEALLYLDSIVTTSGSPRLHYAIAGGGQTTFPLPDAPLNGIVIMSVNGFVQKPSDFTVVADVVYYSGVPMSGGEGVSFYYWLGAGGGVSPTVVYSAYAFMQGVAGVASVEVDTFTDVGAILFDPAKYEGTWRFQSVVEATPGHTAEIRLYDVTNDLVVYGTTLSTSSVSPVELSADVILGSGARIYVVQLRLTAPVVGAATCKMAGIEVAGRPASLIVAPQLTGDVASFNPTGWNDATWVQMSSDASRTVRGLVASSTMKKLENTGANPILFTHQDAGAAATERIITPDGLTFTLAAGGTAYVLYDSTATRWTIV